MGCTADPAVEGYCEPEPRFLPLGGGDYDASLTGQGARYRSVPGSPVPPMPLSLF